MILEFMQLCFGKDFVNCIEDITLEARRTRHGWDRHICCFLDDVIEHLLVLRQWTGDKKPAARLNNPMGLTKCKVEIGSVIDRERTGAKVKDIVREVEWLIKIQKLKINIRSAFAIR